MSNFSGKLKILLSFLRGRMSNRDEYGHEEPFKKDKDKNKQITVRMLKDMLEKISPECDNYEVRFDSACGSILKGDFYIYHNQEKISLNG